VVLAELFEAGEQDLALDALADVLQEPLLDQLPRRLAGPEPGHQRLLHQLAEVFLHPAIDVVAADRDTDVLLAGADVAHLDVLLKFLLGFLRRSDRGGGIPGLGGFPGAWRFGGGRRFAAGSAGRGVFVSGLSFWTDLIGHGYILGFDPPREPGETGQAPTASRRQQECAVF